MTAWRHYARREFPRVVLELGLPAATSQRALEVCPRHGERLGAVTNFCKACFDEAWAEVGRRYVEQGRHTNTTNPKEENT